MNSEKKWLRLQICAVVLGALLVFLRIETVSNTNSASRFATIQSLVEEQTWAIDHSQFQERTIDKVYVDGHFQSSKPPLLTAVGAGIYWVLYHGAAISFEKHESTVIWILNFLLATIPHWILLVFFFRWVREDFSDPKTASLAIAAFAFGYLGLGYSGTLNNHTPAGVVLFLSFYFLRKEKFSASGFTAGLIPTLELPGALFGAILFARATLKDRKKAFTRFLPLSAIPLFVHFVLSYVSSRSLIPVYLRSDLYQYANSYWQNPSGLDALYEPKWIYFFNITFGHHGIYSMTPLLLLGMKYVKRDILIWGPFIFLLFFYTWTTRNYGGNCVGMRWLLFPMPLLFLSVARWMQEFWKKGFVFQGITFAAFAISAFNAIDALIYPFSASYLERLLR